MIPESPHFSMRVLMQALLVFCLLLQAASADDEDAKRRDLEILQTKISKLKKTIDVKEESKSRYTLQLRNIEKNLADISRKIRATEKNIGNKKVELKQLRRTRSQHQKQLSRENDLLAKQVYTAFTLGKQEKVKLLFSQKDPGELQRNLVYYEYFSNARAELINTVKQNIDKIIEAEAGIQLANRELENNRQILKNQKSRLNKDSAKRKTIIASLDKQLRKQGGRLNRLEDEAEQLQNLIASIQDILFETPEPELERKPFSKLRGQLAWPVKGEIKSLFGRQKPQSDLRWQGIMIYASAGKHVRAVSRGRVAFSDWLRGLGNLIIIDHGNAYLSLYGHNESLFKSAGEWVESGDIIGSIGTSGGQESPGLYFEIRNNGKPQNPTRWCKVGNQFTS